jgi:hypothetical protein
MDSVKAKKYVAVNAVYCDGLKGKPEVKPGEPVPVGIDPEDIKALLASGDIKEA